jgi:hypothetical protein
LDEQPDMFRRPRLRGPCVRCSFGSRSWHSPPSVEPLLEGDGFCWILALGATRPTASPCPPQKACGLFEERAPMNVEQFDALVARIRRPLVAGFFAHREAIEVVKAFAFPGAAVEAVIVNAHAELRRTGRVSDALATELRRFAEARERQRADIVAHYPQLA